MNTEDTVQNISVQIHSRQMPVCVRFEVSNTDISGFIDIML